MFKYSLKCIETDYPELLENAVMIGMIEMEKGMPVREINGGYWDYIGHRKVGSPPAEGEKDNRDELKGDGDSKYVYINVITPIDVNNVSKEMAKSNPKIDKWVKKFHRYFTIDPETGEFVWPEDPMRVFL